MDRIKTRLHALRKAVKEAGVVFHDPASFAALPREEQVAVHAQFKGEHFHPTEEHAKKYNSYVGHQAKMAHEFEGHNPDHPDAQTLEQFAGLSGSFSGNRNAFVHEGKDKTYLFKRNVSLNPVDRERTSVDDRQMSLAQREVAYHNMAHEIFGLGENVPQAILHRVDDKNHYSVHEWKHNHLMGAEAKTENEGEAWPGFATQAKQDEFSDKLHRSGKFAKLGVMDYVLGQKDRHNGNYIFSPKGEPQFIDNGVSLSTSPNIHPTDFIFQHYNQRGGGPMHKEFREWVRGLDPVKFSKALKEHDVPDNVHDTAMSRLHQARQVASQASDYRDFFYKLKKPIL